MPRCYYSSLDIKNLKLILTELNSTKGAYFDVNRTQLTHGTGDGVQPASITLVQQNGSTARLTIDEGSGGWVCTPADFRLIPFLLTEFRLEKIPQRTFTDYIYQYVSSRERVGCGDAAVAQGGAGGDPRPVARSPSSSIWGTPNSAGAATPAAAAAGGESPPFVFSSTPTPPPSPPTRRNSNRKSRKNSRMNRRKSTRRRHRTKQNRY